MTTPAETQPARVTLACVACGWMPGDDPEAPLCLGPPAAWYFRIWGLVAHLEEHAGRGEEIAVTAYVGRHRRQAGGPS